MTVEGADVLPLECFDARYVSKGDALFFELGITSCEGNGRSGVCICCNVSIVGTRSMLIFVPRSGTVEAILNRWKEEGKM
jgi:hypothetical protein